MREQFLFGLADRARERTLQQAESCPAEMRSRMPDGFNHNVMWLLGHILTITDHLIFGLTGETPTVPASYNGFFGNGSSPADWTEETPSWETIVQQLKAQPEQVRSIFTGKLNAPVKENFSKAETAGEMIQFSLLHEHTHIGNLNGLIRSMK